MQGATAVPCKSVNEATKAVSPGVLTDKPLFLHPRPLDRRQPEMESGGL